MSSSVAARVSPAQVDSVRAALDDLRATSAGPLIGCNSAVAHVVGLALHAARISRKEFVMNADASRSQVYSALNGAGPIAMGWLWAQSPAFWVAFWPLVAKEKLSVSDVRQTAMRQLIDAAQVLALIGPDEGEG